MDMEWFLMECYRKLLVRMGWHGKGWYGMAEGKDGMGWHGKGWYGG